MQPEHQHPTAGPSPAGQRPADNRTAGEAAAPLSAASRQRLQKVFQHAQRCAEKNDYDYANQLFSQCVVEDPGNLIYVQSWLANLHQKYQDNRKGARLAGLKIKSPRATLSKATGKADWEAAFRAGCQALSLNPWDLATLLALAAACQALRHEQCQLFYLRAALSADPQHVEANRQAGLALQKMGQFDQAIACWQRVQQAQPADEEARQAMARLSVEKTIQAGGYDSEALTNPAADSRISVAQLARDAVPVEADQADLSPAEKLRAAITADPTELENYFRLTDLYLHQNRYEDAERTLTQAQQAAGGGNLAVLERQEDLQLRQASHQLSIATQQYQQDPTDDHRQVWTQWRQQANQIELEVFAARSQRVPENLNFQYELGLRLKRAGKIKEAIPCLQASRGDAQPPASVLLELGECFQKIKQYKLAMTHYQQAVEASTEPGSEQQLLALYRAGVLATGLQEWDLAERYLNRLAGLNYGYRDVADRLDKLAQIRNNE